MPCCSERSRALNFLRRLIIGNVHWTLLLVLLLADNCQARPSPFLVRQLPAHRISTIRIRGGSSHNSNTDTMSEQPSKKPKLLTLTYFDIEGAAEPIRLALALAHVDYTDHRMKQGEWPTVKPTTPYGQVPIIEGLEGQGSAPKAQSGAMLRYIGKHYSETLYPDASLYAVEEALGVVADMKRSWEPCLYMGMAPDMFGHPKDFSKTTQGQALVQSMRTKWLETELPKFADFLTNLLQAHDNQWLASKDAPTIADCDAVVLLRSLTRGHMDHVPTDCLDKYPVLVDYIKRFCALPEIQGRYTNGVY